MNEQDIYYQKRALEYELVYEKPERQEDLARIKGFLANQFLNKSILEIACGTGYWTQVLSVQAKSIYAFDIHSELIQIAQAKKHTRNNVQFEVMDLWKLESLPSTFDGLFGGFIWSHIPKENLALFLETVFSKLQQNSEVIFLDNKYVAGSSSPIGRKDENGNTYQIRKLKSGESFEVLKNFPVRDDLVKVIGNDGKDFEWIEYNYYWIAKFKIK